MRALILSDLHLEFRAPQPSFVCNACGIQFGLGKLIDGATWHPGPCGVCGTETSVTSPVEFGELANDWNLKLPNPDYYDIVILAGDIHVGVKALYWAATTFSKPVLFVPGNHEWYGNRLERIAVEMRACAQELGIHLLDNNVIELGGVRWIGSTLWTDFELLGSGMADIGKALHAAKNGIADFGGTIIYGTTGWFRPEQSVTLHRVCRQFIADELAKPFPGGPTCVITHHLPSKHSVSPRFANDVLSAAFASNVDDLVEQANLWIHGHTHDPFDYQLGKCRVVCNPRGYPDRLRDRYENRGFDAAKIIEIGSPVPAPRNGVAP
jgi:predicted phosphodiesterase